MTTDGSDLTDRQREVLDFIQLRIDEWGYPPTIREIGQHLGIKSTNGVADHLKSLKRKGYLTQEGMKSRTLRPAAKATRTSPKRATKSRGGNAVSALIPGKGDSIEIPMLGRVAAGEPILAEENAEGSVIVDSFFVSGSADKTFALKVVGESMIEDGIFNGDYIFVQKRSSAEPGEIVVALIENEATVKRYYPEKGRIRFQPANSSMEPIYVNASDFKNTMIIGKVVGVYRKNPS